MTWLSAHDALRSRYLSGEISRETASAELRGLGFFSEHIPDHIDGWAEQGMDECLQPLLERRAS
jgi:hypothetical protein